MRFAVMQEITLLFAAIALMLAGSLSGNTSAPAPTSLETARNYYLSDLIKMPSYSPGKNSFLVQKLHRGDRKTLLLLSGSGSVRHIWSTWSIPGDDSDTPAPGRIFVRIFVDGQSKPTISGSLDELCRAAETTGTRFVPLPAFNYKGAFNFYLPIFFTRGLRFEIEATDEVEEFYAQIDYRTEASPQPSPRLVSEKNAALLTLNYLGDQSAFHSTEIPHNRPLRESRNLEYGPGVNSGELTIDGPGILHELTVRGDSLPDLELRIYWDDDPSPAVQAPLRYLYADFTNIAFESKPGQSTCFFPMPFRKRARIVIRSLAGRSGQLTMDYSLEQGPLPARTLYFHAQYHEADKTLGYSQYSVLEVQGEGLFVGMNLFDSGHNHGGGDSALIDAGSAAPRVLHGICGEDYFGFAWHRTGTMTLLTGAPVHERRYRLHLENPYPFHDSLQFSFGVFAGLHPKSVAFWYQLPGPVPESHWTALDAPWKILGPFGLDTLLPDAVTDKTYPTAVLIKEPTNLAERWQDAEMHSGFIDATYQSRHYVMIESGTGFVAGPSKIRMVTYIYSPSLRNVNAIFGHDDRLLVRLNDATVAEIPDRGGFGPAHLNLKFHSGWNKLDLVIYNDENVNWRWSGISLAFDRKVSHDLRFASELPASHASQKKNCPISSCRQVCCEATSRFQAELICTGSGGDHLQSIPHPQQRFSPSA
jgi:D-arabinan exo alpha-(1,3)/(1,5)-arabinofuranosidase (non-reducing end)